jgi:hypothetical protein
LSSDVQEVLSLWRQAERIAEEYEARREAEDDLAAVRAVVSDLRDLYADLTAASATGLQKVEATASTIARAHAALESAQRRIRADGA